MTSVKPYFVQALHEWITDNGLTPLVVIDASYPGARVPDGVIEDGKVTLNVSYDAAENIQMDDELMTFNARFGGVSHAVIVPMESITAIYARENGKGMMFDVDHEEADTDDQSADETAESSENKSSKPHLKLVD
ncbi:ClpXP protease specificity-enhancing factor [Marinicella sp. S1101]|uniref:ClpXP protease specificity-enhancing factor n=1 Tax=Marinicella marina TaxID=2996016 RepID=UPI002260D716|nr:ClpXP protease specificity-enhancing factor [Marinicella marina]MCX7552715.1 ClpXP protease specificity-enhancing factor [Marinicella marina]MDJ1139976.1 ClpXP protease specificity-enhancing factor [Marinicella marina]